MHGGGVVCDVAAKACLFFFPGDECVSVGFAERKGMLPAVMLFTANWRPGVLFPQS